MVARLFLARRINGGTGARGPPTGPCAGRGALRQRHVLWLRPRCAGDAVRLLEEGPDLDAAHRGHRVLLGNAHHLVEVARLNQKEATEELACLRERAVGVRCLAVAHAHGHRRLWRVQRLRHQQAAAALHLPIVIDGVIAELVALLGGEGAHRGGVNVNKAGVLHRGSLPSVGKDSRSRGGRLDREG